MINFLLCTILPTGAPKVYQIHKWQCTLYSVLVEMKDVDNVIYNNFEYHEQLLKMYRFLTRSL